MDEETLQASIMTYKQQLQQVETVLQSAGTEGQSELLQLRTDLQEVISLTQESLLSLKKSKLISFVDEAAQSGSHEMPQASQVFAIMESARTATSSSSPASNSMDDEFAAFQAAIADDLSEDTPAKQNEYTPNNIKESPEDCQRNNALNRTSDDDDNDSGGGREVVINDDDDIAGTQCSVFVTQEWGTKQRHNAIVLSAEPATSSDEEEDIQVRLLFCNPTTKAMLPCPYFLESKCRFPADECRFSHGYLVPLSELHEFQEHDYSVLTFESPCLARYSDNIWYPAIIESVEEDNQYLVTFQSYGTSETLGLDSIIPTAQRSNEESSDDSESDSAPSGAASRQDSENDDNDEAENTVPCVGWQPTGASSSLGDWEAHTRGIGSKIMAMMGYEFGKGLGKDGQGRRDIVEAVVYPQGKSLDKCMELRERKQVSIVGKKRKGKGHKGGANKQKKKQSINVFDFINKKLGGKKVKINELIKQNMELSKPGQKSGPAPNKFSRDLNVQLVKVHEEIRNTTKQLKRWKVSLTRNQGDAVTCNQVRAKMEDLEQYLQRLHSSESRILQQQNSRNQHKKLTIF